MTHRELIAKMTLAEKCALLSGRDVWHKAVFDCEVDISTTEQ